MGVPDVLDLVVGSAWQPRSYRRPPADKELESQALMSKCMKKPWFRGRFDSNILVSELPMQAYDRVFFLLGEVASFDVWSQVVRPSQSATLPAPQQPWGIRQEEAIQNRVRFLFQLVEHDMMNLTDYQLAWAELANSRGHVSGRNPSEAGLLLDSTAPSSDPPSDSRELSPSCHSLAPLFSSSLLLSFSSFPSLILQCTRASRALYIRAGIHLHQRGITSPRCCHFT